MPLPVSPPFCCLQQVRRGQKFHKIREKVPKKATDQLKGQGICLVAPFIAPLGCLLPLLLLAAGLPGSKILQNTRKSPKKVNPAPKTLMDGLNVPPFGVSGPFCCLQQVRRGQNFCKIRDKSPKKVNPAPKTPRDGLNVFPCCPLLVFLGPFAACSRSAGVKNFEKYAKKS